MLGGGGIVVRRSASHRGRATARYEVASRAVQRLLQAHASVLGVVLNKRPQHIPEWLYKRI